MCIIQCCHMEKIYKVTVFQLFEKLIYGKFQVSCVETVHLTNMMQATEDHVWAMKPQNLSLIHIQMCIRDSMQAGQYHVVADTQLVAIYNFQILNEKFLGQYTLSTIPNIVQSTCWL